MINVIHNSGNFIWPITIIFLGIVCLSFSKYYQVYVNKDIDLKKLRSGINIILYLGILNILIGCFAYYYEVYTSSIIGEFFVPFLFIIINTSYPGSLEFLTNAANISIKSCSLAMVSIFLTIVTAFVWFGLWSKLNKIKNI